MKRSRYWRRLVTATVLVVGLTLLLPALGRAFDNTNILVEEAVNHIYQRRFQEAHNSLKMAYEQSPRHPGVHFNLGRLFELTGNFTEALKEYRLAAVLDPSMISARRGVARCTVELKRQKGAQQAAVMAMEKNMPEPVKTLPQLPAQPARVVRQPQSAPLPRVVRRPQSPPSTMTAPPTQPTPAAPVVVQRPTAIP